MSNAIYEMSLISMYKTMYQLKVDEPKAVRLWKEIMPEAWRINDDNSVEFILYYPNASRVYIVASSVGEFELKKEGEFWRGTIFMGTGIVGVNVFVDGNEILSSFLPIGYGGNRPINYIDIPEADFIITEECEKHGTVTINYLRSETTKRLERLVVYLPPDYYNDDKKYPVIYLQHGHGENELAWFHQGKINFVYDKLIASGKVKPAIIVMSNGMYFDERQDGAYLKIQGIEKLIVEEVIPYIDEKYRTISNKDNRAIAGLSMGSMQTSMISLGHSELFSYVGIFSGFVKNFITDEKEYLSAENFNKFKENIKLCFRGIGEDDEYMEHFLEDDLLLENNQIMCIKKIYKGAHEWKVWRRCFYDFAQMIF